MTTPEALKALYAALGGTSSDVAGLSKNVDLLNAIDELLGGDDVAITTPEALSNIATVASGIVIPTGKLTISGAAEVDCSEYATAQVVDANLIAGNIKKDVTILGVTGTYAAE